MVDTMVAFLFCVGSAVIGAFIARKYYLERINLLQFELDYLEDELTELKVELDTYGD